MPKIIVHQSTPEGRQDVRRVLDDGLRLQEGVHYAIVESSVQALMCVVPGSAQFLVLGTIEEKDPAKALQALRKTDSTLICAFLGNSGDVETVEGDFDYRIDKNVPDYKNDGFGHYILRYLGRKGKALRSKHALLAMPISTRPKKINGAPKEIQDTLF